VDELNLIYLTLLISLDDKTKFTGINSFTLSDVIFIVIWYIELFDWFKKSTVILVDCLL